MKLKRILLSLVVVMLIIMFAIAIIPTNVLAATATTPLYLGITELRTNNTPNLGYAIGNPNDNGVTGTAAKIWNIVRYSDSTSSTFTETDIYCVKAGVGFSDTNTRETYNTYYNMKTKEGVAEILAQENTVLPSIVIYFLCMLISTFTHKSKKMLGMTLGIVFGSYILYMLSNDFDKYRNVIAYISIGYE